MNKQKKTMKRILLSITCLTVLSIVSIYSSSLWAQETDIFVANTTKAVAKSSGWEKGNFSATILPGSGKCKFTINPPFPHSISGKNDSYVQAAIGIGLMNLNPQASSGEMQLRAGNYTAVPKTIAETEMSWFLKAALQDEMDAIMVLAVAYAIIPKCKNLAESERWFRRAMELGNSEAEVYLNDLLAGKRVVDAVKFSNAYKLSFKRN